MHEKPVGNQSLELPLCDPTHGTSEEPNTYIKPLLSQCLVGSQQRRMSQPTTHCARPDNHSQACTTV